jgi:hypothetical protein
MRPELEDKLGRTITSALRRAMSRSKDPIVVSEIILSSVVSVIDMETEESGIGVMPADMEINWDEVKKATAASPMRPKRDIPSAPAAVVPPSGNRPASVLVLPGDPGFDDTKPKDLPKGRRVISSADVQRTPPKRPGANVPERQYWDEATLMATILENTPEKFDLEIPTPDGVKVIPMVRNIHNQQGMGSVVLTYRYPQISEMVTGDVTVDLIAKRPFSLYDENCDFEDAFHGPKGIMPQLLGMYGRCFGAAPEPLYTAEPPPLSASMLSQASMASAVEISGDRDHDGRLTNPGGAIVRDQDGKAIPWSGGASDRHWKSVIGRNDSVTPQHTQVKPK